VWHGGGDLWVGGESLALGLESAASVNGTCFVFGGRGGGGVSVASAWMHRNVGFEGSSAGVGVGVVTGSAGGACGVWVGGLGEGGGSPELRFNSSAIIPCACTSA